MVRPAAELVHCAASGQPAQAAPNAAVPPPVVAGRIGTRHPVRAGHGARVQVDVEASLVNRPPGAVGGCTLVLDLRARGFQPGQQLPGAVGGVAIDRRRPRSRVRARVRRRAASPASVVASPSPRAARSSSAVVGAVGQVVGEQVLGGLGVTGVARGDHGGGDDLGVRVDARHGPCSRRTRAPRSCARAGVCGSTVEITRSLATRRAIRNTPSSSWSRSWPTTVASNRAAWPTSAASSRPSSAASSAIASRASASTSASRAAGSS